MHFANASKQCEHAFFHFFYAHCILLFGKHGNNRSHVTAFRSKWIAGLGHWTDTFVLTFLGIFFFSKQSYSHYQKMLFLKRIFNILNSDYVRSDFNSFVLFISFFHLGMLWLLEHHNKQAPWDCSRTKRNSRSLPNNSHFGFSRIIRSFRRN